MEFPKSRIAGDETRIRREPVGPGEVAIIGVEDLYLDRVRQATADPEQQSISYRSGLAIAAAALDVMDWPYVETQIQATLDTDPRLGRLMKTIDRKMRRTIRRRV